MTELMRLERLSVHFPLQGSAIDRFLRRSGKAAVAKAVDGIDLSVRRGEVLALVGESGSGKTTAGRVIVKLTQQTDGRIVFDGQDVSSLWGASALRPYRRRVQMIFQDPYQTLNPRQSVFDYVAEPVRALHLATGRAALAERVGRALEDAGLRPASQFAFRYPHELSGGQRQRVAIAGALVVDPDLIVADEPVSMLDVSVRAQIISVLAKLREDRGLTFVFITHDLGLAWLIADRIAVMYLGRIVELGDADEIVHRPKHPYTQALIAASPKVEPPDRIAAADEPIPGGEIPSATAVPAGCRFHPRCPLAFDRCRVEDPPPIELDDRHWAACWLALDREPTAASSGVLASGSPLDSEQNASNVPRSGLLRR